MNRSINLELNAALCQDELAVHFVLKLIDEAGVCDAPVPLLRNSQVAWLQVYARVETLTFTFECEHDGIDFFHRRLAFEANAASYPLCIALLFLLDLSW